MLVGGRIVPSLTHNWLVRNNPGRLPRQFARFDALALGASGLPLAMWIVLPQLAVSGVVLLIAGVLQTARLARWAGDPTFADRLVLVLHTRFMASHTNCFASKRESTHPSHLPCNPYELDADCLFQLCDPVDCFLEAVVAE
jgi:uncharacterized protein involved in response to NO